MSGPRAGRGSVEPSSKDRSATERLAGAGSSASTMACQYVSPLASSAAISNSIVSALCVRISDQTATNTPSHHTVVVSRSPLVPGSPPGAETYYNGMMRHGINQLGAAHMAAGVAPVGSIGVNWGQLGSKALRIGCTRCSFSPHKFSVYGAGGTGIEPAPCGFGALGALSRVVQHCLNCALIRAFL
jgi:hypothetical protein